MKERRNFYKSECSQFKKKNVEMQRDNETLFKQVTDIQEASHAKRADNAKLQGALSKNEVEI